MVRKEIKFDLCHAVPPQSAPDFIKTSPLSDPNNPHGYVEVNKLTLQHTRFPIFFPLATSRMRPAAKPALQYVNRLPLLWPTFFLTCGMNLLYRNIMDIAPARSRHNTVSSCWRNSITVISQR